MVEQLFIGQIAEFRNHFHMLAVDCLAFSYKTEDFGLVCSGPSVGCRAEHFSCLSLGLK